MIAPEVDHEHRGSTRLEGHHELPLSCRGSEDGIRHSRSYHERAPQRRVKLMHEAEPPCLTWPIKWCATQEKSGIPDPLVGGATGECQLR